MVAYSPTLAIDQRLRARRAAGERVCHLGFGEAGLPVHPALSERLVAAAAGGNAYGPVNGDGRAREAAAGYFVRRGLPTEPAQVVYGPGSKALLFALLAAIPGDVVLPRPSWVSYAAQAALAGRQVHWVPAPDDVGGVPEPAALEAKLSELAAAGRRVGSMVLTVPDNPTGTVADAERLAAVAELAVAHDLVLISDEIYADLVHDVATPDDAGVTPVAYAPERTVVTTGLSKSLALGGWRIGVARFPAGDLGDRLRAEVVGVASEVWSSLAGPMQEVAAYAFDEPAEVIDHVAAARRLHGAVSRAVAALFVDAGARMRTPRAAFYLYPDLESSRPALGPEVRGGSDLAELLLERYAVGVLAGEAFGDEPEALRFRVATSLLYGETDEQRWTALHSDEPTALPWIAAQLDHLGDALNRLRGR